MKTSHIIGIGLVGGKKESLRWDSDKMNGPEVLKERCRAYLSSLSQPDILIALNRGSGGRLHFIEEAIRHAFDEVLDLYTERFESLEEHARQAEAWNAQGGDRHWTVEDLVEMEKEENWNLHHGPPYSWDEIEDCLGEKQYPPPCPPPTDRAKCLECLEPMEWIWFSSSAGTWELYCGCAGWTPICRKCKTWRRCDGMIIS